MLDRMDRRASPLTWAWVWLLAVLTFGLYLLLFVGFTNGTALLTIVMLVIAAGRLITLLAKRDRSDV